MGKKQGESTRLPYDSPVSEVLLICLEKLCVSPDANGDGNDKPYIIGPGTGTDF